MKRTKSNNFDRQYDSRVYAEASVPMTRSYHKPAPSAAENQPLKSHDSEVGNLGGALSDIGNKVGVSNVLMSSPKTFKDVQSLVNSLVKQRAVIVDMSSINVESRRRILDYLSGAIFALQGAQQRVATNIYLFTPSSAKIGSVNDQS